MRPPTLAMLLLIAVTGENESEFVAGDLHEEFIYLCATRGHRAGRRWYSRQVLRSVITLLGLRMRSGEAMQLSAAVLSVAVPLLLLDRLWCFVYSQIPLKDGLERTPGFLAAKFSTCSPAGGGCNNVGRIRFMDVCRRDSRALCVVGPVNGTG
jgi:hypothetical protein